MLYKALLPDLFTLPAAVCNQTLILLLLLLQVTSRVSTRKELTNGSWGQKQKQTQARFNPADSSFKVKGWAGAASNLKEG
jgi:hypothetical protein